MFLPSSLYGLYILGGGWFCGVSDNGIIAAQGQGNVGQDVDTAEGYIYVGSDHYFGYFLQGGTYPDCQLHLAAESDSGDTAWA